MKRHGSSGRARALVSSYIKWSPVSALYACQVWRGGEAVGFVPSDRILVPPVDREGMRRNAGSAVECELRLRGGRCR